MSVNVTDRFNKEGNKMAAKNNSDDATSSSHASNSSQETGISSCTQTDVAMDTDSNISSEMTQSGDLDASFASCVSDASTINTSTGSSANAGTSKHKCHQRPGIQWKKGEKIEAMDSFQIWYAAKFADIDFEEKLVLIHFEGWNQRYDEWVPFDSDRLRPITRHSERKEGKRKQKRDHRPGELVLAKWTDCKMYPAKITDVRPDGSLEVMFYDGFKRIVQPINVRPIPPEYKQTVKSELRKLEHKGASTSHNESEKKHHRSEHRSRSSSQEGKEETVPVPVPKPKENKTVKKRPSALKMLKKRSLTMTKTLASKRTAGRKRVFKEMKKAEKRRKAPPQLIPKKKQKIAKKSQETPANSDKTSKAAATPSSLKQAVTNKSEVRTKKRAVSLPTSTAPETRKTPASVPPVAPSSAGTSKHHSEAPPLVPTIVAPKAFKIEEDHNLFKCTHEGCTKSFRKENLLESHVKYYHIDESKILHTPVPRAKRKKTISSCSTDSDHSMTSGGKGTSTPNEPSPAVSPAKRRHTVSDVFPFSSQSPVNFASPKETQTPHEMSPPTISTIKEELRETSTTTAVPGSVMQERKSRSSGDVPAIVARDQKVSIVKEEHMKHNRSSIDSSVTEGSVVETEDEEDGNEIVNCVCGFYETDGLMIQCDVCLCWQHALCLNLDKDSVPTNYICFMCESPPGYREGSKCMYNQEWLKSGNLPSFSFLNLPQTEKSQESMQATHSLIADLHNISAVLQGLHEQIKASEDSENPECSLWYKNWDDVIGDMSADTTEEFHSISVEESPVSMAPTDPQEPSSSKVTPVRFSLDVEQSSDLSVDQPKFQLPLATESLTQALDNVDTGSEASTMTASESSTSFLNSCPSNPNIQPESAPEAQKAESPEKDESNKETKVDVESLTRTRRDVDKESVFKSCQRNLLFHIIRTQNEINQRLDLLEEQVSVLEKTDTPDLEIRDPILDIPVLKRSLHSLMRDLYKVKRMAAYH